jgi:hypothetical protein
MAKIFPGRSTIVRQNPNDTLEQHIATLYAKPQRTRTQQDYRRKGRAKLARRCGQGREHMV